jgi:hypothetical protein
MKSAQHFWESKIGIKKWRGNLIKHHKKTKKSQSFYIPNSDRKEHYVSKYGHDYGFVSKKRKKRKRKKKKRKNNRLGEFTKVDRISDKLGFFNAKLEK